jgi:hypothetical protein
LDVTDAGLVENTVEEHDDVAVDEAVALYEELGDVSAIWLEPREVQAKMTGSVGARMDFWNGFYRKQPAKVSTLLFRLLATWEAYSLVWS